jgi:hypothetical protein
VASAVQPRCRQACRDALAVGKRVLVNPRSEPSVVAGDRAMRKRGLFGIPDKVMRLSITCHVENRHSAIPWSHAADDYGCEERRGDPACQMRMARTLPLFITEAPEDRRVRISRRRSLPKYVRTRFSDRSSTTWHETTGGSTCRRWTTARRTPRPRGARAAHRPRVPAVAQTV